MTGADVPNDGVAATAYFVVAECLTNIAKHAGAAHSSVTLELGDPLRVSIDDDGWGGAILDGAGTGLRGLVDRVEASGGLFKFHSGPDGTTVSATMPSRQPSSDPGALTN